MNCYVQVMCLVRMNKKSREMGINPTSSLDDFSVMIMYQFGNSDSWSKAPARIDDESNGGM